MNYEFHSDNESLILKSEFNLIVCLTFLLSPSFPLVTDLHEAHGQDNGHYEEENAPHHPRRDGFMLHASRNGKLGLFRRLEASY